MVISDALAGHDLLVQSPTGSGKTLAFGIPMVDRLEPAERQRLVAAAAELDPWLQGPFLLGGDLVVGGAWRTDLRWKLLGAIPLINVITGVVVSGLSTSQRHSVEDIGVSVLVALIVAFTISLELTLLVSRSVLGPMATRSAGPCGVGATSCRSSC